MEKKGVNIYFLPPYSLKLNRSEIVLKFMNIGLVVLIMNLIKSFRRLYL